MLLFEELVWKDCFEELPYFTEHYMYTTLSTEILILRKREKAMFLYHYYHDTNNADFHGNIKYYCNYSLLTENSAQRQ